MAQVFLSYAHEDSTFVDRLHRDLSEAGIPAMYDKVALEIGDSIVEKISGIINESACVVGVVSPSSVDSKWVQRELSWALTGELAGRAVRVFPAVIGDCDLPPMLADRLFADFRHSYFPALRALIHAIKRSLPADGTTPALPVPAPFRYDTYLQDCEQLESAIAHHDRDTAFAWLQRHPWVIASLVANPRDIVLAAPPARGMAAVPTFVCWTLVTQDLWHLVCLGPLPGAEITGSALWTEAERLASRARVYAEDMLAFVRACTLTEPSGALTKLLAASDPDERSTTWSRAASNKDDLEKRVPEAVLDRLILLIGRREDHSNALLEVRGRARRELGVEIKSYEWLLEALGGKLYRRGGAIS